MQRRITLTRAATMHCCIRILANPCFFSVLLPISALFFLFMSSRDSEFSPDDLQKLGFSRIENGTFSKQRTELYDKMSKDLHENGAVFLAGGQTSQSLSLSELFVFNNGVATPVLKLANPPVRANVLYLNPRYSQPIAQTVKQVFLPNFGNAIWFQDENMYHSSMYHASHHLEPVNATAEEIQTEASSVKDVAMTSCPLEIQLERTLLTSTGVLVGCWQVINGTDPAIIRRNLQHVLPRAPQKQLYNPVMLHTSLARLLGFPQTFDGHLNNSNKIPNKSEELLAFFDQLVSQLNKKLGGYRAIINELWFVEEFDVLALALNGRMRKQKFTLECMTS